MDPISTSPSSAISGSVTVCGGGRMYFRPLSACPAAFEVDLARRAVPAPHVWLSPSPCRGFCTAGPIAARAAGGAVLYCSVQPEDVPEIVEQTIIDGQVVKRLCYDEPVEFRSLASYRTCRFSASRSASRLHNCGMIDPEQIDEYIARDGYRRWARSWPRCRPKTSSAR